jgi:hypothetical protein
MIVLKESGYRVRLMVGQWEGASGFPSEVRDRSSLGTQPGRVGLFRSDATANTPVDRVRAGGYLCRESSNVVQGGEPIIFSLILLSV